MRHDDTRSVVAIPARNERDRIGACLAALAADRCALPLLVVLFVNNSDDGTETAAREAASSLGLELAVSSERLEGVRAHAGEARRRAMEAALARCRATDLLLTTDADGRVMDGWRRGNHAAVTAGADVVCGRALIDPVEALAVPRHLHDDDARETAYFTRLDRIASLLDPDRDDPWPRHGEESGASIAVRPAVFRAAGGVPSVASGEDRALLHRLRLRDARIRHEPSLAVIVSGRLTGRADGGMADTMRRRIGCQDEHVDERLEPVADALRRVRRRRAFRELRASGSATSRAAWQLGVTEAVLRDALRRPFFGEAWDAIERSSAVLATRTPIPHLDLAPHMERADRLLARLEARSEGERGQAADRRSSRYEAARLADRGVRRPLARSRNSEAATSPVQGVSVAPVQLARSTRAPGRQAAHTRDARSPMSGPERK